MPVGKYHCAPLPSYFLLMVEFERIVWIKIHGSNAPVFKCDYEESQILFGFLEAEFKLFFHVECFRWIKLIQKLNSASRRWGFPEWGDENKRDNALEPEGDLCPEAVSVVTLRAKTRN